MEKKLAQIYSQAHEEITDKWNAYLTRSNKQLDALWIAYQVEKDPIKKRDALLAYQKKAKAQTFRDMKYKDMIEETAYRMAKTNELALLYVNGELPKIYQINYNHIGDELDKMGVAFNLVNEDVVARLSKQDKITLPKKKLNIPKDELWNTRKLNSAVLQGILQGESMRDISKRIEPIVNGNKDAAIRNARTMVTGAENGGRIDSYNRLEQQGVIMAKVWIATPDERTRTWHLDLDGQEVGINEDFVDGNGNKLQYPGDPHADPSTVYNCRCSMSSHIKGFRKSDGHIEYINIPSATKQHEKAIEEERREREHK